MFLLLSRPLLTSMSTFNIGNLKQQTLRNNISFNKQLQIWQSADHNKITGGLHRKLTT